MATGEAGGVSAMSRAIWRRLAGGIGISSATLSMVASTSSTTSRWSRIRNSGRLEAISTPFLSRIKPRGGGTRRKLNWLEADRV